MRHVSREKGVHRLVRHVSNVGERKNCNTPSITIDHVQVAEIDKNTMTVSIEISSENIDQKTVKTKTLLDTGAGGKFIDQNFI